ncbi:MAG: hypothetical protein LBM92_04580, partial [Opitutaceae bacterium]|nr:hypothetical protein [Opitutaceae bacterium]
MAQKKPASKSKTTSNSTSRTPASKPPAKTPRRREIGAAVCLVLALLLFFGYGGGGGPLIVAPSGLVKGLIGYGFFVMPPALLLCGGILCFHRGKPVRFRVTCALLIPVVLGILIHLFACKATYDGLPFGQFVGDLW